MPVQTTRSPALAAVFFALLVCAACGGDQRADDADVETDADGDVAADADAEVTADGDGDGDADGSVDADLEADVEVDADRDAEPDADPAATCPEGYVTGRGNVFPIEAPTAVAERDLPCLAGDGRLHGYYLLGVGSSLEGSAGYEAAFSTTHEFLYAPGESRFDEVQAYYVVAHMTAWVVASLEEATAGTTAVGTLRGDEVLLDYDRAEVESRQWCGLLTQGMQRVTTPQVNVDVMAHEFGHHVVFALNRNIENSMLHEGLADFLAAAFTGDPVIEPSEWPTFDRTMENDLRAPDDLVTREEYCQALYDALYADGLETVYPGLLDALLACLGASLEERERPAHHAAGPILGAALWEILGLVGPETLHPMLFAVLNENDVDDTGVLMDLLIAADAARHGGAHEAVIRDAFASRGIDVDLELPFRDMGFYYCP